MNRKTALHSHIMEWQHRQFKLGEVDCVTFTCAWVDSQLGTDYAEVVKREVPYTTKASVLRVVSQDGGYESLVRKYTSAEPLTTGMFEPGDIALFQNIFKETTLGVLGQRLVYSTGPEGLVATDSMRIDCFWRLEDLCRKQ